jgi:hypothetical protein
MDLNLKPVLLAAVAAAAVAAVAPTVHCFNF